LSAACEGALDRGDTDSATIFYSRAVVLRFCDEWAKA
jgi:hypothetical protein